MDIELMSNCDYFVGTLSSTLGRAAFEIMTARLGHAPPFVSLDRHGWFYAQGGCTESGSSRGCSAAGGNKNKGRSCPTGDWIHGKTRGGLG